VYFNVDSVKLLVVFLIITCSKNKPVSLVVNLSLIRSSAKEIVCRFSRKCSYCTPFDCLETCWFAGASCGGRS